MEPDFDFRMRNSHFRGTGWFGLAALGLICATILGASGALRTVFAAVAPSISVVAELARF